MLSKPSRYLTQLSSYSMGAHPDLQTARINNSRRANQSRRNLRRREAHPIRPARVLVHRKDHGDRQPYSLRDVGLDGGCSNDGRPCASDSSGPSAFSQLRTVAKLRKFCVTESRLHLQRSDQSRIRNAGGLRSGAEVRRVYR